MADPQPESEPLSDRLCAPWKHGSGLGDFDGQLLECACRCGHPIVARTVEEAQAALRDHMGYRS